MDIIITLDCNFGAREFMKRGYLPALYTKMAVTEEQMELWVKDFDSWDICDQCIAHLFGKSLFAYKKPSSGVPEKS